MHRPLFLRGRAGRRQDRAGRRRWPRSLGAELIRLQCYEGIDAAQALYDWDFPRQLLHLRAAEAAAAAPSDVDDARGARCTTGGSCSPGRCCRRCETQPARAARRRDRPGRRRVRGVPARGAHRLRGDRSPSSARSAPTTPPLVVLTSQPHPRGARRAQAPLPLPLARAPGLRARGRDPAAPAARGHRAAGRARSPRAAQRLRDAGPAQAARRRRDARLGPGAASRSAPATLDPETAAAHARRRAEVPRGRRPGARTASTGCWPADDGR